MDRLRIVGGRPLHGEIHISGAKNAALPLMAASLLTDERLTLENLPHLVDITTQVGMLVHLGVEFHLNGQARNGGHAGRVLEMCASRITSTCAPYDLVRKMRASILVLGPLVARMGHAEVSLPGGCAIGSRPVDLHLSGLERLGARIELAEGYVRATAPDGLTGAEVVFPKPSVGATENLMMAAALASGETRLVNAAREPEISDLADCLRKMGADISGAGSDTIVIRGVSELHGAVHSVLPDRIETGTYAMAAAITDGELDLVGGRAEHLGRVLEVMREAGVSLTETNRGLSVKRANGGIHACDVTTEPYPGFPTDLQAQLMALMTVAEGESRISEAIFENRFMHVPELCRMGADIAVDGTTAVVQGPRSLSGAPVMATDLRASVTLVLAGLAAEGESILNRVYHLDRGYERLEEKLSACGAEIERIGG